MSGVESPLSLIHLSVFFFTPPAPTQLYTLSLHDALPISAVAASGPVAEISTRAPEAAANIISPMIERPETARSEEHTSELQSLRHLVCRLLLEKKKKIYTTVCPLQKLSDNRSATDRYLFS